MTFDKDDLGKRIHDGQRFQDGQKFQDKHPDQQSLRESLALSVLMHRILVSDRVPDRLQKPKDISASPRITPPKSTLSKRLDVLYKKTEESIDDDLNPFVDTEIHLDQSGHTLDIYLTDDENKIQGLRGSQHSSDCQKKQLKYSISLLFAGDSDGKEYGCIDFFSKGDCSGDDVKEGILIVKKVFSYLASSIDLKEADAKVVVGYRRQIPSLDPLLILLRSYGGIEACVVDIDTEKVTSY